MTSPRASTSPRARRKVVEGAFVLWDTNRRARGIRCARHTSARARRTTYDAHERGTRRVNTRRTRTSFKRYMYCVAGTTTTTTTMRAAFGKQLGSHRARLAHASARASRSAARAQQQQDEAQEQQQQQQQQQQSSSMQKTPMGGGATMPFRRGTLPVGLTSLLGRDFPSLMSSPFALTDRMFDMLDFPSEFREMYEPFQRLMHRDSVSALPDKLPFAVNILEKKDHYLLTADLPGLNTKNVKVSVDSDKQLHIKALRESRHEEESDEAGVKIHAYERSFGSFDRKFQLPESVDAEAEDAIQASMKDGVLSVRIKKTPGPEPEVPKPTERQIEIKTSA